MQIAAAVSLTASHGSRTSANLMVWGGHGMLVLDHQIKSSIMLSPDQVPSVWLSGRRVFTILDPARGKALMGSNGHFITNK